MELKDVSTFKSAANRQKVDLYFSCRQLVQKDVVSESDPYLVLYQNIYDTWKIVGKTEIKWNIHNPDFSTSFQVDFVFERRQLFKVECRDADDEQGLKYDSLGSAEFELGTVIGSAKSTLTVDLIKENKRQGKVSIRAENSVASNEAVIGAFEGLNMAGQLLCFAEKPYFTIAKLRTNADSSKSFEKSAGIGDQYQQMGSQGAEEWQAVYDSELGGAGPSHRFRELIIPYSKLCSCNPDLPLKVASD